MKAMKTKEDFLQYSKELNYRIADLEKEKSDLVKSSTKDKEMEMKKYMNVLNKLKIIKDNSRMGQSFAWFLVRHLHFNISTTQILKYKVRSENYVMFGLVKLIIAFTNVKSILHRIWLNLLLFFCCY